MNDTQAIQMQKFFARTARTKTILAAISIALALLVTACKPKTPTMTSKTPPPLPAGVTWDPHSEFATYWPGTEHPALVRLRDDLIFAIPPQNSEFWLPGHSSTGVVLAPVPLAAVPRSDGIGFIFFMPDLSGLTPNNYKHGPFDPTLVEVSIQVDNFSSTKPGVPGSYPPNMWINLLNSGSKESKITNKYGLQCVKDKPVPSPNPPNPQVWCYGRRDGDPDEYIMFWVDVPPFNSYVKFPMMQAEYFSPQYGGIKIVWRTSAKWWPHWKDIDQKVWQSLKEWNVTDQYIHTKTK